MVVAGIGSVGPWASQFPDNDVSFVISLIVDSWKTFQLPSDRREVPVTREFCAHLRCSKDRSCHRFWIDWESPVLSHSGGQLGRLDIRFSQGWDEHVYLSIECKRLRVRYPGGKSATLADKYVEEGMYRYFNGQYATGLDKGGMLGYVLDGKIAKAVKNVGDAISTRKSQLHMAAAEQLRTSSFFSGRPYLKETRHQWGPSGTFRIQHIFLSAS